MWIVRYTRFRYTAMAGDTHAHWSSRPFANYGYFCRNNIYACRSTFRTNACMLSVLKCLCAKYIAACIFAISRSHLKNIQPVKVLATSTEQIIAALVHTKKKSYLKLRVFWANIMLICCWRNWTYSEVIVCCYRILIGLLKHDLFSHCAQRFSPARDMNILKFTQGTPTAIV